MFWSSSRVMSESVPVRTGRQFYRGSGRSKDMKVRSFILFSFVFPFSPGVGGTVDQRRSERCRTRGFGCRDWFTRTSEVGSWTPNLVRNSTF